MVKDKNGALNIDELRIVKDVTQFKMFIDTLTLTAGEVIYEDFTQGPKPEIKSFELNIKGRTYKNITTAEQLGTKILSEILAKTTIKSAAVLGGAALAGIALFVNLANLSGWPFEPSFSAFYLGLLLALSVPAIVFIILVFKLLR